jgi:hypothetical protein
MIMITTTPLFQPIGPSSNVIFYISPKLYSPSLPRCGLTVPDTDTPKGVCPVRPESDFGQISGHSGQKPDFGVSKTHEIRSAGRDTNCPSYMIFPLSFNELRERRKARDAVSASFS